MRLLKQQGDHLPVSSPAYGLCAQYSTHGADGGVDNCVYNICCVLCAPCSHIEARISDNGNCVSSEQIWHEDKVSRFRNTISQPR
jgi:hypothetical protein